MQSFKSERFMPESFPYEARGKICRLREVYGRNATDGFDA
jgi:hypothetical protein